MIIGILISVGWAKIKLNYFSQENHPRQWKNAETIVKKYCFLLLKINKRCTKLNLKNYKPVVCKTQKPKKKKERNQSLFYCKGVISSNGKISKLFTYVWYRSMLFFQVAFSSKWDTLAQRNYKQQTDNYTLIA